MKQGSTTSSRFMGDITLVRDPRDVMRAHEAGLDNLVSFLTDTVSPDQLTVLQSVMDEAGCDRLDIY